MSIRRLGVGVVVLGGYLYVVGGFDGILFLNIGKGLLYYNKFVYWFLFVVKKIENNGIDIWFRSLYFIFL